MDEFSRKRLAGQVARHEASARREIEAIVREVDGLTLDRRGTPGWSLTGRAERITAAAVALTRYASALEALDDVSGLMEDA